LKGGFDEISRNVQPEGRKFVYYEKMCTVTIHLCEWALNVHNKNTLS